MGCETGREDVPLAVAIHSHGEKLSAHAPFKRLFAPWSGTASSTSPSSLCTRTSPAPRARRCPRSSPSLSGVVHRFIHNGCICRNQEGCVNYP